MKTLFLNPPSFERFDSAGARFAATRKTRSLWYPAWLGYAAAFVPQSKLIDCPAAGINIKDLLRIAKKYQLIVIYTSSQSFTGDSQVAKAIKKNYPKTKIIFVGPHVSTLPKQSLKTTTAIDAVARREFEETILEITQKKPWRNIKGLTYRRGSKIFQNPDRLPIKDLDRLPFVSKIYRRDLPLGSYHLPFTLHPYLSIYAGRGCPNQCTFCLWPQTFTGRTYRHRSVNNIVKEVAWIKRHLHQIKEIFFDDDTFTINQNWVKMFCDKIAPLKVTWSVNARANLPYNLMNKMKSAGCRVLVVGYESGDDQILKNIRKGVSTKQMTKFTENAKKTGLMIHGTFILGLPGENLRTIGKTFKFACKLDPETLQVSIATPLPGTDFYHYCEKAGFLKKKSLVDQAGYQSPVVSYPKLSAEEIQHQVERFHHKYYFRPHYILKTAKIATRHPREAKRIFISSFEFGRYLIKNFRLFFR